MSQLPTSLMKFPGELIVRTLQFCNSQGILRFSATCRNFHELVRSTTSLQFQIELEANRLQLADNHAQGSQHELLEALKRYRDNWLDLRLDPSRPVTLISNGGRRPLTQLHNGLFANVYSNSGLASGPLEGDAIEFIPLDEPAARWNIIFDVVFHQLAMDSTRDLVVLASIDEVDWTALTLHFRSLKIGLAHPLAEQPVVALKLAFPVTPRRYCDPITILVAEGLLVINLVSSDLSFEIFCDVLIIDWHTGVLLRRLGKRLGFCSTTYLGNGQLAIFVAESTGIVTNSMSLLLFDQICTPLAKSPWKDNNIYDVSACPILSPILDLKLPSFRPEADILMNRFRARSALMPGNVTSCSPKFVPNPWCQMLSLTMRVVADREHRTFTIFVDVQRILRHLPRALPQTPTESLPWQTWGEDATRWVEASNLLSDFLCSFHGSRFVTGQRIGVGYKTLLTVADFNPTLIKKVTARELVGNGLDISKNKGPTYDTWPRLEPDLEERRMLVDNVDEGIPTVIEGLAETPIVSRLPYRVAVVGGPDLAYDDWMVDGNRLVGLKKISPDSDIFHGQLVVHYIRD